MDAIGVTVVFAPERGCRMSSVEAAAEAFRRYASAKSLCVNVLTSCDISDVTCGGHFFVRTMEGQEQHGRHEPLVADSDNELYVELASYLYESALTKHIIKFEMNALNYEHPLTQTFFGEVARCLYGMKATSDRLLQPDDTQLALNAAKLKFDAQQYGVKDTSQLDAFAVGWAGTR
jgi:hypothetical protein